MYEADECGLWWVPNSEWWHVFFPNLETEGRIMQCEGVKILLQKINMFVLANVFNVCFVIQCQVDKHPGRGGVVVRFGFGVIVINDNNNNNNNNSTFDAVWSPEHFDTLFKRIQWKMRECRPKNNFRGGGSEGGQEIYILVKLVSFISSNFFWVLAYEFRVKKSIYTVKHVVYIMSDDNQCCFRFFCLVSIR